MRYFIDTEFDGYRGPLISMAIVREDGRSLYFIMEYAEEKVCDPWVIENVLPILRDCPEPPHLLAPEAAAFMIGMLLMDDLDIEVVADWPDDIKHLCDLLHYSPGSMVPGPHQKMRFTIERVDAYPTPLPGAVQHNAWWDAVALKERIASREANGEPEGRDPHQYYAGDTVRLKGGFSVLTVEEDSSPADPMVMAVWVEGGQIQRGGLYKSTIMRV